MAKRKREDGPRPVPVRDIVRERELSTETMAKEGRLKLQVNVRFSPEVADRLRNAAYWLPGTTVNRIIEEGTLVRLAEIEEAYRRQHKRDIPQRPEPLPKGTR